MTKTMKKTDEFVCDMRPRCARRAHGNLKQRHLTRNRGGLASSSPLACRRRYLNNAKKKKTSKPHTVYPRFKPNQQPRRARRADGSQRPHQELRWPPVSPRKTNYNCRRTVSRSSAHPELF